MVTTHIKHIKARRMWRHALQENILCSFSPKQLQLFSGKKHSVSIFFKATATSSSQIMMCMLMNRIHIYIQTTVTYRRDTNHQVEENIILTCYTVTMLLELLRILKTMRDILQRLNIMGDI